MQEEGQMPILLSEKETAQILGFAPKTLQKWRSLGKGPTHIRISKGCVRYRREDLHEWISTRVRTSTSDTP